MDGRKESRVTLDSLPDLLTIVDISSILRMDVHIARRWVKRNRSSLKPFKAGREVRCLASNFKHLLEAQQAAN